MTTVSTVDVCVVGSLNLDLVARVERLPGPGETVLGHDFSEHPGGKGANQAVAAARAGARTSIIGAVGNDAAGRTLASVVSVEGVDVTGLMTVEAPTGRALIGVDDTGENSIMVVPGANAALTPQHIRSHAAHLRAARVVLMQLEIPVAVVEAVIGCVHPDTLVVLNPAPATPLPAHVLERIDVLIPNEHELNLLGGAAALVHAGVRRLLVTEGARGARLHHGVEHVERVEAWPVTPVDTTAAGDAFCGVFAAWLARGASWMDAADAAAAGGALATTQPGAIPSLPGEADVHALLAAGRLTSER